MQSPITLTQLAQQVASKNPGLGKTLHQARMHVRVRDFVKDGLRQAIMIGVCIAVLSFLFLDKMGLPPIIAPVAGFGVGYYMFQLHLKKPQAQIERRRKEIDRQILHMGRFLLVKLNSGTPLLNAIYEGAKSYGVGEKYFEEIVQDIELGTPLEKALENSVKYSPSDRYKKVFFQIVNALKIGIDVTGTLEATLDEISHDQLLEIQRYGKKLSSVTMFYMLAAVVVPSLGMTMFSVVAGFVSIPMNMGTYSAVLVLLLIIQLVFIGVFKGIRPNVEI